MAYIVSEEPYQIWTDVTSRRVLCKLLTAQQSSSWKLSPSSAAAGTPIFYSPLSPYQVLYPQEIYVRERIDSRRTRTPWTPFAIKCSRTRPRKWNWWGIEFGGDFKRKKRSQVLRWIAGEQTTSTNHASPPLSVLVKEFYSGRLAPGLGTTLQLFATCLGRVWFMKRH